MSRLRVRHETGFSYAGPASASYNEARMLPARDSGQFVVTSSLIVSPLAPTQRYVDYWGTEVAYFDVLAAHDDLRITAESLIEVRSRPAVSRGAGWDGLPQIVTSRLGLIEQLDQTSQTRPHEEVIDLARTIATRADSPHAAAMEVCAAIHEAVSYVPGSTEVQSTAQRAWSDRSGVCQDIAHIVLGALRVMGIPARYVSGYLHPDPDAPIGTTVTGESHAWVEWSCGDGWFGYDPTNMIGIGERHVIVGRGRDYNDVAPLRGVYAGPPSELFVTVEITREA